MTYLVRRRLSDQIGVAVGGGGKAGGDDAYLMDSKSSTASAPAWTTLSTGQLISSRY
ncbi:MAG: hypothetical protein ACLR0P_06720 [Oscillospiraceae bacterium]